MNATKWNKSISAKKDTGERFSTKSKSTCKNSGTFEGKKIHLKKSLTSLLHQAIQLCLLYACIANFLSTTSNIILFASRGYGFCFTSCSGLDIGSKTVLCKLLLNQQMSGMRVNLMSHKTSNSLPRNTMQKRDGNRTNEV